MADLSKCAHPACDCLVQPKGPFGKYCSDHCKEARGITELRCGCQHADCRMPARPAPSSEPARL